MRCVTRRENPDGTLRVGMNHSVVVVSASNYGASAAIVMSHEEWTRFLIDAITSGPVGVMHDVKSALYPDDGK